MVNPKAMAKKKGRAKKPQKKIEPKIEPKIVPKIEPEVEAGNGSSGLIKTLIIAGTFFSIAALSILTQGLDGGWPSPGVVAVRMGLLSLCAAIYFLMLYRTRISRAGDDKKPQPGKK